MRCAMCASRSAATARQFDVPDEDLRRLRHRRQSLLRPRRRRRLPCAWSIKAGALGGRHAVSCACRLSAAERNGQKPSGPDHSRRIARATSARSCAAARDYRKWVGRAEHARGPRRRPSPGAPSSSWTTTRPVPACSRRLSSAPEKRVDPRAAGHARGLARPSRQKYGGDEVVYQVRGHRADGASRDDLALRDAHSQGHRAPRPTEPGAVLLKFLAARERPRRVPVHRRRVPVQARRRGSQAPVRRRGHARSHQQALPLPVRRLARHAAVDGLRLGHALRRGPGPASGHLRQDRRERRLHLHARRHAHPLQRLRPLRSQHVRVDDDQRPRADHPRDVPQRGHRPAGRGLRDGERSRAQRRPGSGRASATAR